MNKPTKPTKDKPNTDRKQRGIGVLELLFAAAIISAPIIFGALTTVKKPPGYGD